jgi:hypothetical protein
MELSILSSPLPLVRTANQDGANSPVKKMENLIQLVFAPNHVLVSSSAGVKKYGTSDEEKKLRHDLLRILLKYKRLVREHSQRMSEHVPIK